MNELKTCTEVSGECVSPKNRASTPALLKSSSSKTVVISSLSGSIEESLSAEMKVV